MPASGSRKTRRWLPAWSKPLRLVLRCSPPWRGSPWCWPASWRRWRSSATASLH
ncbi:hypothetical protein [Lysobacter gummosus]|uniref:hypothetical protein n=1 Tax=Lysobacter gummosus TaxID=262324 RepID=UPI0036267DEB